MGLSGVASFDQNLVHDKELSALPESLLRKDDVFYEDLKIFVEKGFRPCDAEARESIIDEDVEFCDVHNISSFILTLLDDLSNKGLWSLAKILTSGSVSFSKTRPKMIRVIKCSLHEIRINRLDSNCLGQIQKQLSQLLRNPNNFCQNHCKYIKLTRKCLLHALDKVNLRSLPVRILCAMLRKLNGTQGFKPQMGINDGLRSRDRLVKKVTRLCEEMIHQHNESDKLQLVKALAVPSLYSKIASNYQDLPLGKFVQLPPEVEALQNEIIKAIQTLEKRIKKEELKKLKLILDPESTVGDKRLKKSIRIMLIDCLFGCNDMEAVPDSLLKALSYIKKKPCKTSRIFLKEVIEEEVECILDVGAHLKHLMWDSAPLDQLDQDFADAYMEELEEIDDGDIFDYVDQQLDTDFMDEIQSSLDGFREEVASNSYADHATNSSATSRSRDKFGNINEYAFSPSFNVATFTDQDGFRDTKINEGQMNSTGGGDGLPSPFSPKVLVKDEVMDRHDPPSNTSVDTKNLAKKCSMQNQTSECPENRYLAMQEVCDQASLIAYQLIGHILAEFGQLEALGLTLDNESYLRGAFSRSKNFQDSNLMDEDLSSSIVVQAVNEVIPSFPTSQLEILKDFMST